MRKIGIVAAAAGLAIASHASAQSLTTLFAANNGGSNGGAVYFDLQVGPNPISITAFETNTAETFQFDFTVYSLGAGTTHVGNETSAGWSVIGTGAGTGMGRDIPSPVTLNGNINLAANTAYAFALVLDRDGGGGNAAGHDYTNGTGGNQSFGNADLSLRLGTASNVPFTTPIFNPRVWNGTILYEVIPAPASLALLGLGGLVAARRRR